MSEAAELVVYAEATTKLQSRGMRAGRVLAPAPQVVPARWSHAAIDEADTVLCGRPTTGLHHFPAQTFRTLNPYLRCRECDELAGHPTPPL